MVPSTPESAGSVVPTRVDDGTAPGGDPIAGQDLRGKAEELGAALADRLGIVIAGLPQRAVGPQRLGEAVGATTVTASRLLRAIGQNDPVATLQLIPGPKPLRQVVEGARTAGSPDEACDRAIDSIDGFDEFIREVAGDRSALKAILSGWLPEERREFEAQRRQSIFKARAELDGVSCELALTCIMLAPSVTEGMIDIVDIECMRGIDRMRPDSPVRISTHRLPEAGGASTEGDEPDRPRLPTNLDGDLAVDGIHTVRLDEYCDARPAPLVGKRFGPNVQYSLGPTGFGPGSKVDLVFAEVNRGEIRHRLPTADKPSSYFFSNPGMPTRKLVFDLVVHEDLFPGCTPSLIAYDTSIRGLAVVGDPERDIDRRSIGETVEPLGQGPARMRVLEFPRYSELRHRVCEAVGWEERAFRAYRVAVSYPMMGLQLTMAFVDPPA